MLFCGAVVLCPLTQFADGSFFGGAWGGVGVGYLVREDGTDEAAQLALD